ncbi:VOC family protein [Paenibacillus humicola]|uniref:VOC family protein n=1 Tax=Paenibacillus humicola TaxID=3110540 RepID=UPI00237C2623|nr:VOC family protein [Paenibacillus humicola]
MSNREIEAISDARIAPWLVVDDAEKAAGFYAAAFGTREKYRLAGEDGRPIIVHLAVGEADFWIQDEPGAGSGSPGQAAVRMILTVRDPDAVFERALAAGAVEIVPISEGHGWRIGRIADPFGHHWEIGRPLEA